MKTEFAPIPDTAPDSKNGSPTCPVRGRRPQRRSAQATSSNRAVRFFLSKSENNSVPGLDRDSAKESEAIVESLKTGKSYFVISEWKGFADLQRKCR
jgi:hypothetical protein